MPRRRLIATCAVLAGILLWLVPAAGATHPPREERITGAEATRIIRIAEADEEVRMRLALRDLDYDVRAYHAYVPEGGDGHAPNAPETERTMVRWTVDGREKLLAIVDPDAEAAAPIGHAVYVMPGTTSDTVVRFQQPRHWLAISLCFAACLLALVRRRAVLVRVGLPLLLLGGSFVAMLLDLVPPEHVRLGNVLLHGIPALVLLAWGVSWLRDGIPGRHAHEPVPTRGVPGHWSAWAVVAAAALAVQVSLALDLRVLVDVAYASQLGADLVRGGAVVYGNTWDIGGFLGGADTYGPLSYWAYVPGAMLREDVLGAIVGTNVALELAVAVALFVLVRRVHGAGTAMWAVATWVSTPFVAYGVATGHNDVVVATALLLVALVAARPAWRGAMLAAAAATKILPALCLPLVLRRAGEPRSAATRCAAAFLVTLVVLFAIGFGGVDGAREFWNGAVLRQLERDDVASIWGLAGLSSLRKVAQLLVVAGIAWAAVRSWRRGGTVSVPLVLAGALALALLTLPQYFGTYATWLVPCVLVGVLTARTETGRTG